MKEKVIPLVGLERTCHVAGSWQKTKTIMNLNVL
jgi:hypothetical protein